MEFFENPFKFIVKRIVEILLIIFIADLLEKAASSSVKFFGLNDPIRNIYSYVDIIIIAFYIGMIIVRAIASIYVFSDEREEKKKFIWCNVIVFSVMAGLIDYIMINICPMVVVAGYNGFDGTQYVVWRPLGTAFLGFLNLGLLAFRYRIFAWIQCNKIVGYLIFSIAYVLLNIILHCITFGFFRAIFLAIGFCFILVVGIGFAAGRGAWIDGDGNVWYRF